MSRMYSEATKERFEPIFYQLWKGMLSAGGDGDSALFLRYHDYKEVAELFKEYEVEYHDKSRHKMKEFFSISEDGKSFIFHEHQESITIGEFDIAKFKPSHYTELIIII